MTWVVATLIVILMIIAFLFIVNALSKTRIPDFNMDKNSEYNLGTHEMLFAMLSYKNLGSLIGSKNYAAAEGVAEEALGNFISLGVRCNFYVYDSGILKFEINNGVSGNLAQVDNSDIKLRCANGK